MHGNEPPRQGRNEIGLGDDRKREHEVGNSQRNPSCPALLGQLFIHEAIRIATVRDHQMLHVAVSRQGRITRERMSKAHGNYKVFFVDAALFEARRDVIGRKDCDIDGVRLEIDNRASPHAGRRGQELTHADVAMRGAIRLSLARSGRRITAETPSGAPIANRRTAVAGLKGAAVAMTLCTRARISAIGAPSSVARAVGTTPLGVLRKSGSLRSQRNRPSP